MDIQPLLLTRARRSGTPRTWKGIMLHWSSGDKDAHGLHKYQEGIPKGGWYHYIIDENGVWMQGDPRFNRGAHAGSPWNDHYIGVCFAHPIVPSKGASLAVTKRGLQSEVATDTPSSARYHTLDPRFAATAGELLTHLCSEWNIPRTLHMSRGKDLTAATFAGVIAHHHVNTKRWDVRPWLPAIAQHFP